MATKQQESRLSLKLLIDEKTSRVVAAEAEKEFVDILFSFLSFPMGTIIRVTSREQVKIPVTIGCMNNLYRSIQNSPVNWHTEHCKTMVLNPRNPCAIFCSKLKMNIDDSGSEMMYQCSGQILGCPNFGKYRNVSCGCSVLGTTKEMKSDKSGPSVKNCRYGGAFLQKGSIVFLISDDLQIGPASPHFLAQLLSGFGLSETSRIREMAVDVSKEQVIRLLARSLVSKSPLSDVFLPNQWATSIHAKLETTSPSPSGVIQAIDYGASVLYLKVKVNKNTNKILYAEATDEFFDFLCSLLTVSIGSVIRALRGNSGLGCIDNLYTSVKDLDEKWFGSGVKDRILDPGTAQHHNCKKQPLNLTVQFESYNLIDPRKGENFAEEPSLFIVTDDLEVNPLSFASSFQLLREVKVPFSDIEEHVISVGMKEALGLLKAALTSPSSALTNGLSTFLKKQKA